MRGKMRDLILFPVDPALTELFKMFRVNQRLFQVQHTMSTLKYFTGFGGPCQAT